MSDIKKNSLSFLERQRLLKEKLSQNKKDLEIDPLKNYPLSAIQEGVYFHEKICKTSFSYINSVSFLIKGKLDASKFEKACQQFVNETPLWSINLTLKQNSLFQFISKHNKFNFSYITFNESKSISHCILNSKKTLLTYEHLYQFLLYKNAPDSHVFVLHCHHLVSDGWSFNIILERLSELYHQIGEPLIKPDYRFFQHAKNSRSINFIQDINYWRSVLTKPLNYLNLLPYKPTHLISNNCETQRYYLDEQQTLNFDLFLKSNQLTAYMFFYAAFILVLHTYSGDDKLVIGTTSANRKPEEYKVVGMFANILPLVIDMAHKMTCHDLLQKCKTVILNALKHQSIPYSSLIRELNLNNTDQQFPLFDILYVCQNASIKSLELSNLNCSRVPFSKNATEFGLSLEIWNEKNSYTFECHYKKDYYPKSFITNLLADVHKAALFLINHKNTSINQFQLINEPYKYPLKSFEDSDNIISFFKKQVSTFPQNIAIRDETGVYTYLDLDQDSNTLAQQLKDHGIKKNQRIGIFHERSYQFIVALIAILKCKCSYVPLDPCYPNIRLANIISQSKLHACLSFSSLSIKKDIFNNFNLHRINSFLLFLSSHLTNSITITNEIYVIFTSGSSGTPKGVSITHTNLLELLNACSSCFNFLSSDRFVLFHSPSFDFSVFEIFACLLNGSTLYIPPLKVCLNPSLFVDYCYLNKISVLCQTPSFYYQLQTNILKKQKELFLRYLIFGGEKLAISQIKTSLFSSLMSNCNFINMYGITEVTIHATFYKIKPTDAFLKESIIGKALNNTSLEILDKNLRSLAPYIVGEFYLSGPSVCKGYLNDTNNKSFIFCKKRNTYLYKSGDFGYLNSDHNLVYLHRKDKQIQLRGFRIEIEEIKTALSTHSNISNTYILKHKSKVDHSYILTCFYISNNQKPIDSKELEKKILKSIPRYMCPSQFIHVQDFPLTGSFKIDDQALLNMQKKYVNSSQINSKLNKNESILKNIWSAYLGHDSFSVHDSFFLIGGDSLKAMSVLMDSNKYFKEHKDLAYFFQNPTIFSYLSHHNTSNFFDTPNLADEKNDFLPSLQSPLTVTTIQSPSFLTGATGFIGTHILHQYLMQSSHDIYCFVRAKTSTQAMIRLKNSLSNYALWQDTFKDRIKIVLGDLTEPQCGLSTQDWQTLPNLISDIIHCASSTNFNLSYHHLKHSNVIACKYLLELACQKQFIPFNYISTLSVFNYLDDSHQKHMEDLDISYLPDPFYGYAQSKRMAEYYITQAHHQGLPIRIIRPGTISWSTSTNISNDSSIISAFLNMLNQGFPLPTSNPYFSLFPVNIFSNYLLKLISNPITINSAFHFSNPSLVKLTDYADLLSRIKNYKPYYLTDACWNDTLAFEKHPLFSFKSFLSRRFKHSDMGLLKYYSLPESHNFSLDNTLKTFPNLLDKLPSSKSLLSNFIYKNCVTKAV